VSEQGLMFHQHMHIGYFGDDFYRIHSSTNSVKALEDKRH